MTGSVASARRVSLRADASGSCSYAFMVPNDVQLVGTNLLAQWSCR